MLLTTYPFSQYNFAPLEAFLTLTVAVLLKLKFLQDILAFSNKVQPLLVVASISAHKCWIRELH